MAKISENGCNSTPVQCKLLRSQDLLHNSRSLLSAFLEHPQSSNDAWKWASFVVKQKYSQSIRDLAEKDTSGNPLSLDWVGNTTKNWLGP